MSNELCWPFWENRHQQASDRINKRHNVSSSAVSSHCYLWLPWIRNIFGGRRTIRSLFLCINFFCRLIRCLSRADEYEWETPEQIGKKRRRQQRWQKKESPIWHATFSDAETHSARYLSFRRQACTYVYTGLNGRANNSARFGCLPAMCLYTRIPNRARYLRQCVSVCVCVRRTHAWKPHIACFNYILNVILVRLYCFSSQLQHAF